MDPVSQLYVFGHISVFCMHVLLELLAPYKHCLHHMSLPALLLLIGTPV